ncbi:hypothetical protein GOV13_05735, partial [Candidatus Pacearchaeota archaeon]|nr:hypothetical protein [Candidatus Pacearchaeota archaeon]
MEYRGINLTTDLPADEASKLTKILDGLPLIMQGVNTRKGQLTNEESLAILKLSKNKSSSHNIFRIDSQKDFGVICHVDLYLVRKGESELPNIAMK